MAVRDDHPGRWLITQFMYLDRVRSLVGKSITWPLALFAGRLDDPGELLTLHVSTLLGLAVDHAQVTNVGRSAKMIVSNISLKLVHL